LIKNAVGFPFPGALGHFGPGTPLNAASSEIVFRNTVKSFADETTSPYPK
jgi:hypothetical protein